MLVQNRCRPLPLRKSHLSAARQRLLEVMQAIGYGHLHNLTFRNGDPLLDEPLAASLRVRADKPTVIPRAAELRDYVLRDQQATLMRLLDMHQDGRWVKLLILNGLPSDLENLEYCRI